MIIVLKFPLLHAELFHNISLELDTGKNLICLWPDLFYNEETVILTFFFQPHTFLPFFSL